MELTIENLAMTYKDGKEALKSLNITLTPGIYGLLGENGAGKTTLINLLTTNLNPTRGRILLNGKDVREDTVAYVSKIGYMPQQQGIYREMTAIQFLSYMAGLKGIKKEKVRRQIPLLLQKVNLADCANKRLGAFSGGMKQRILVAQAMLGSPQLLIFDEPTAGLDPKERIRIRNLISELSFSSIVLIATHVVTDIEFISKEVLILRSGELIRSGDPDVLLQELDGKVYSLCVSQEEYEQSKRQLIITSVKKSENQIYARVVGSKHQIMEQLGEQISMREAKPELDDLYLWLFRK